MAICLINYSTLCKLRNAGQIAQGTLSQDPHDIFSRGITTASFQPSGKIPESNLVLIIFVFTGIRGSIQDFSSSVGIGTRQQDADFEFAISMHTSSSVSVANVSNVAISNGIDESLRLVSLSSGTAH